MALLPILQFPDPRLRSIAEKIVAIDIELQEFINNMVETMYENNGVGLAATQVNVQKRIFTMDCSSTKDSLLICINPEIFAQEGTVTWEEGCLSFPGIYAKVKRAQTVSMRYMDQHGTTKENTFTDLEAICVQHEFDHLNGKLFFDHLSTLQQGLVWDKINRSSKKRL